MTTALVKRETTAMVPQPRQKYYRFHELLFSESRIMLVMMQRDGEIAWVD
jgi:hypothetical protein